MRGPMLNNSAAGDAIYEPFSGSGTTLIAAETTGRACLAMEISPDDRDVGVLRWQQFAGRPAVRDGEDRTFDEVAATRIVLKTPTPAERPAT